MSTMTTEQNSAGSDELDIVARLKKYALNWADRAGDVSPVHLAIAEIERLRALSPASDARRTEGEIAPIKPKLDRWRGPEGLALGLKQGRWKPVEITSINAAEFIIELIPYVDELLKIADQVGEPADPFAAWEAIDRLQRSTPAPRTEGAEAVALREALENIRTVCRSIAASRESIIEMVDAALSAPAAPAKKGEGDILVSRKSLEKIVSCIDNALGDTDPNISPDYTDDEIRRDYPIFWVCQQLSAMLKSNPTPAPQAADAVREALEKVATQFDIKASMYTPGLQANKNNPYAHQMRDAFANGAAQIRAALSTAGGERRKKEDSIQANSSGTEQSSFLPTVEER